jgi:Ca2+-binding EF-hand superfamily protein
MTQKNCIKELTTLIFRQREQYVSYDEFFSLLNKLNITHDPESALGVFRILDSNASNYISIQGLD